jgi:hypothetical protein
MPQEKQSISQAGELPSDTSNQSVELTATRHASTFNMIKTVSVEATLALGGGSSLLSRWPA